MDKDKKIEFNEHQLTALNAYLKDEEKSDATPTILGFVFQNILAIKKLFTNKNKGFVFCECVEDISLYDDKNALEVFQAKYYKDDLSNDSLCEISAFLFYDYIRLKDHFDEIVFYLCTKRKNIIPLPTYDTVEKWIIKQEEKIKKAEAKKEKGAKRRKKSTDNKGKRVILHFKSSNESTFNTFSKQYHLDPTGDIEQLRSETCDLLWNYCNINMPEISSSYNEENLKALLLSLAYQKILNSLKNDSPDITSKINERTISKEDITKYWEEILADNASLPLNTLLALIDEIYFRILNINDDLHEKAYSDTADALDTVYSETKNWIKVVFSTTEGQIAFLKTASRLSLDECDKWASSSSKDKISTLLKQYDGFMSFFKYLWKIIIDIYFENGKDASLLKLDTYLNVFEGYIEFHYNSQSGVILPYVSDDSWEVTEYYLNRLKQYGPAIWYMGHHPNNRGLRDYNWPIDSLSNGTSYSVIDLEAGPFFYIECLNCIHVSKNDWKSHEKCNNCIFSNTCKIEGKEKWPKNI